MAGRQSELQEDARFRILRLLEENPEMSQRELADAVGISTGSAHYVLGALIERGLVKLGNFSASQDKRRYAYVLTPKGVAEKAAITRRFRRGVCPGQSSRILDIGQPGIVQTNCCSGGRSRF